jgi:cobalt-precorrin-7 (C5)-methyltransferase
MEHKITVVGIGPGSPDYLLPVAARAINAARIIVGSKRAIAAFAPTTAETYIIDRDIRGVLTYIRAQLSTDDVVVLVSGDPGFYSLLSALRQEFGAERLRVIPGISSVQLAFARIAELWQGAELISMHGRTAADETLRYLPGKKLGILTDSQHNPSHIAQMLIAFGWPPATQVWLCANLSYENEQIFAVSLAEAVNTPGFDHSVMVVTA